MPELNPAMPPLPERFKKLPLDERGYPIPKFVYIDAEGKPDFRVVRPDWIGRCYRGRLCWLCGEKLGRHFAFTIGPMCVINKTTSEPPSHLECAEFACRACPFLAFPNRKRDEHTPLPAEAKEPGGIMLRRNPGAIAIYVCETYKPFRAAGGTLFRIGEPSIVHWRAHGREATRAEVDASIKGGMPALRQLAEQQGPAAVRELIEQILEAEELLPAA